MSHSHSAQPAVPAQFGFLAAVDLELAKARVVRRIGHFYSDQSDREIVIVVAACVLLVSMFQNNVPAVCEPSCLDGVFRFGGGGGHTRYCSAMFLRQNLFQNICFPFVSVSAPVPSFVSRALSSGHPYCFSFRASSVCVCVRVFQEPL